MTTLNLQTFEELVSQQVAAIQAEGSALTDFNPGSLLLALCQSNAGIALWSQAEASFVQATSRLGTSYGNDVITFVTPFGFIPTPAVAASNTVNFTRFTPTNQVLITSEILVSAPQAIPPQSFAVFVDTTNPAWDVGLNAYVIPAGNTGALINIPVRAIVAGSAGNVSAGLINTIDSVIVGIDSVTNASAFTNGSDGESDPSIKQNFPLYFNGLSKGTNVAVQAVLATFPQITRSNIVELKQFPGGAAQAAYFYVLIDDGTGSPPGQLITDVTTALEDVRALGIQCDVYGPLLLNLTISLTLTTTDAETDAVVQANVTTAIDNYINALGFGGFLPYSKVADICYNADPTITNVTSVLLNSATSDITATENQVIFITSLSIAFT